MQTERIREIIGRFDTAGTVADLRAVGNGWINDTYRVMTVSDETPDYILQRINHHVFKDVELLQRNIERVTSHIRRKLAAAGADDLDRRVLRIVPARDGRLYHFDGENYWRMTLFIAGSVTHETISAPLALLTGRAFGEFQAMLSDMEDGSAGRDDPGLPQHRVPDRGPARCRSPRRSGASRESALDGGRAARPQRRDVSRRTAPPRRPASEARHALRHEGQQPAFR